MKMRFVFLAITFVAACSAQDGGSDGSDIPSFVEIEAEALQLQQESFDDVYIVSAFFDAGSSVQASNVGPAFVALDTPMIYIAASNDLVAGGMQYTPEGWTMGEPLPQCSDNCAGGKERLLSMLRAGAKIRIDEEGMLVVRTEDGRQALGTPAPMNLVD